MVGRITSFNLLNECTNCRTCMIICSFFHEEICSLGELYHMREYVVEPETDLKMKISLESVNNAPFNAWIKIPTRIANFSSWNFMLHLAKHLSNRFPKITFVVASGRAPSPFTAKQPYYPPCPEDEKYIYLYKGGRVMEKLTWMEWARKYLLVEASFLGV